MTWIKHGTRWWGRESCSKLSPLDKSLNFGNYPLRETLSACILNHGFVPLHSYTHTNQFHTGWNTFILSGASAQSAFMTFTVWKCILSNATVCGREEIFHGNRKNMLLISNSKKLMLHFCISYIGLYPKAATQLCNSYLETVKGPCCLWEPHSFDSCVATWQWQHFCTPDCSVTITGSFCSCLRNREQLFSSSRTL